MNAKCTHTLGTLAITMLLSFNASAQLQTGESLPRLPLPWPEVPLNQWRFDDPAWLTNARTQPLWMSGPSFVANWSGYALRMAGEGPSLLALPEMSADGKTNLPANGAATLRFWFAPDWASASAGGNGPGEEVRLLETGAWSSENAATRCALVVEADGEALRLDLAGSLGAQTIARGSIQWHAGVWHQVAVVSSSAGTFLYVDGQSVASGTGFALLPIASTGWANGFCVGSDLAGGRLAQGSFDELKTFARVLAPGDLALDYERNAGRAALGPIVPGMAMESSAPDLTNTNGGPSTLTSNKAMLAELYGCALWLHIARSTNNSSNVVVTLNNTVPGTNYQILSKTNLNTTSWANETNVTGAGGQDWTQVTIPMLGRSNLFLIASQIRSYFLQTNFAGIQFSRWTGLQVWDLATGTEVMTNLCRGVSRIVFSDDGRWLAAISEDTFRIWDSFARRELTAFAGQAKGVSHAVFNPRGQRLVLARSDGTIKARDIESARDLTTFVGLPSPLVSLAFSPNGRFLAAVNAADQIAVWDADTGQRLSVFKGGPRLAFSQDGRRLASGNALWDSISGNKLMNLAAAPLGFSPDGKRLICFDRSDVYLYGASNP